jgi:hypothetical protein
MGMFEFILLVVVLLCLSLTCMIGNNDSDSCPIDLGYLTDQASPPRRKLDWED